MSRTLVLECEELRTRNPKAASESRPYCAISSPTAWPMTSLVRRAWLRWSTSLALPSASAAWVAKRSAIPGAWGSIASDAGCRDDHCVAQGVHAGPLVQGVLELVELEHQVAGGGHGLGVAPTVEHR